MRTQRPDLDRRADRGLRDPADCARPRQLVEAQDLELDRRQKLGRQALAGGPAEALVCALEPPLLIMGELARPREVDVAHAPGAALRPAGLRLLGLALLGGLDERGDLIVREDVVHAALAICASPPQARDLDLLAPGLLARDRAALEVDAHRASRAPAGHRGAHGDSVGSKGRAHGVLVAGSDVEPAGRREHLRAPDEHGGQPRAGGADRGDFVQQLRVRRCRRISRARRPCRSKLGSTTCAIAATGPRSSIRTSPMQEPSPRPTSTSPACCVATISPMRTTSSATTPPRPGRAGRGAAPRRGRSGRTGTRTCRPRRRRSSSSRGAAPGRCRRP